MSSRPHDLFLLIPTIDDAREAVTEWARKVDTTYQALSEAAGMLMPLPAQSGEPCKACGQQIPESKPSTVRHSTGGLVAALCTETGMPRDFWMYHAGDEFRRLVIERINARLTAGQKGRVQEAGQAHAAFTWVKNDIVRRLKARAAA